MFYLIMFLLLTTSVDGLHIAKLSGLYFLFVCLFSCKLSSKIIVLKYSFIFFSGNPKFGEKHARQFKDITVHFESEVDKIHEQLNSVGSSLSALQDALPVKMLEAANHKLEARCNVLEQVCEQIKNKSARLEQANQELDSNCGQLRQINQNLEVRCLYLEQVTQANESEKTHLQENVRDLESKVMELAARNEKAIGACRQLEEINQKLENKSQSIEESKKLLESRYKSCVSDNQKLEAQIGQCQKMLDQYKK